MAAGEGDGATRRRWWVALAVALAAAFAAVSALWVTDGGDTRGRPAPHAARRREVEAARAAPPPAAGPRVSLSPGAVADDRSAANGLFGGRVVSRGSGRGVARATLTFARDGSTRAAVTGGDGAFRWSPDAPGAWSLVAVTAEGHLPAGADGATSLMTLEARPGVAVEGLVIPLAEAVRYEATVRSASGAPVAGATVRALDEPVGPWRSGPDGTFTFSAPDGTALLAAHPDHAPALATVNLAAQASRRLVLRLGERGDAGAWSLGLAGTVTDESGAPIDGASVSARPAEGAVPRPAEESGRWRTRTGPDGRFAFEAMPAGRFAVRAEDGERAPASATAAAGERDVRLTLTAGRSIAGTVRDARSGRPVASFVVAVAPVEGALERGAARAVPFVDGGGRFVVRGLAAGPHGVRVAADGRAPSEERIVDTRADARVDVALGGGGALSGVVIERATGRPLEGARVSLEGRVAVADLGVDLVAGATADARGRFELTGVAVGLRSIFVAAEGHHARVLSGLRVEEGRASDPVTVDLAPVEDGGAPGIELAGIGAVLGARGDALVIGRVIPGGGAAEVGLREGDAVREVEGVAVRDLGFEGAVQRIRGPEGSAVRLTVDRGDAGTSVVAVPRRRIRA